jgi:hypothetical protein
MLLAYKEGNYDVILQETRKFDSFEDWPWPLLYKQLYTLYKNDAVYVLTTRITGSVWLQSLKNHCLNTDPDRPMRTLVYGYKYPHGYETEHLAFYENHNTNVRNFFRERDAPFVDLCWEKGDGWKELCAALKMDVPHQPFPHVKPREFGVKPETRRQNEENIAQQLRALGLTP